MGGSRVLEFRVPEIPDPGSRLLVDPNPKAFQ